MTDHPQSCRTCKYASHWNRRAYQRCEAPTFPGVWWNRLSKEVRGFIRIVGCASYSKKTIVICTVLSYKDAPDSLWRCRNRYAGNECRADPKDAENCRYAKVQP